MLQSHVVAEDGQQKCCCAIGCGKRAPAAHHSEGVDPVLKDMYIYIYIHVFDREIDIERGGDRYQETKGNTTRKETKTRQSNITTTITRNSIGSAHAAEKHAFAARQTCLCRPTNICLSPHQDVSAALNL